jgi:hypothetical protein
MFVILNVLSTEMDLAESRVIQSKFITERREDFQLIPPPPPPHPFESPFKVYQRLLFIDWQFVTQLATAHKASAAGLLYIMQKLAKMQ